MTMGNSQYERNSFLLYKDSRIFIDRLDKEQRGDLLAAIFAYVCDGEIPDFHGDGMTQMCFEIIKSYLDRDEKKYQEKCRKRAEAGQKGGLAKASNSKQSKAKANDGKQCIANLADNDTDTDTDTDSVSVIDTDTDTVSETDTKDADAVSDSVNRPAGAAAAEGAAPQADGLFSVKQLLATVKSNKVNLTEEGIQVFYEEMQKSGWILYQKPIEKKGITRALRAWAKYHPEYSLINQKSKNGGLRENIEDKIYKIAHYYISQELFDKNEGGHHTLISKYCPKEAFTEKQLNYMADEWCIWPRAERRIEVDEDSNYYRKRVMEIMYDD